MELITQKLSGYRYGELLETGEIQVKVARSGEFVIQVKGVGAPDLPKRVFKSALDARIYADNFHGAAGEAIAAHAAANPEKTSE